MAGTVTTLWRLFRGQRFRYACAGGAIVVSTLVLFILPRIFQTVIDYTLDGKTLDVPSWVQHWVDAVGPASYWAQNLWIAGILIVSLTAIGGVGMYFSGRWVSIATERVVRRLRDKLYNHIQRLSARYHDTTETGDLIQRCTSDVETLRMFLEGQVSEIVRSSILIVASMAFMLPISVPMTLVSMSILPLILFFSCLFFRNIRLKFKSVAEAEGAMTSMLQENFTGIRVVRAFARQEHECASFGPKSEVYRDRRYKLTKTMAVYWSISDFLCTAQKVLALAFGAHMVINDPTFSVGDMFAFLLYVQLFIWPLQKFGRILVEAGKAVVSIERIDEVLTQPREPATIGEPLEPLSPRAAGRLAFSHVTFSHDGDAHALKDVSFSIEPGKTLALLGPSGSGKSTIAHLLLRLYEFDKGAILLDGQDIRQLPRDYVRSQIGSVLQEPFLFSRSLRDNIKIGRRSAQDEEMHDVAEAACLRESIQRFDAGYDTLVGERGVTLSGGQRQRIALARAILRDPPILLLDDALSAVDTRTEAMILEALKNRSHRHTTVVIAHRISTLKHADSILVLDHGEITQRGTHKELLEQPGLYQRLCQAQYDLEADLKRELGEDAAPTSRTEGDA